MKINKNQKIGLFIIGVDLLIGYIIYAFNSTVSGIIEMSSQCTMEACPHVAALKFQTKVSIVMLAIGLIIGIILLLTKEKKEPKKDLSKLKTLDQEERKIFDLVEEEGSIFQSDLVEKSGMTKVKVTRILDRLEGKQLIERKRRGMTNMVIIK